MALPAPIKPAELGKLRVGLGFRPKPIWAATNNADIPITICKLAPLKASAVNTPNIAPIKIPALNPFTTGQSTAPFLLWLYTELNEVKAMVAKDVATAICVSTEGEKFRLSKVMTKTGTITRPPPMPNNPASRPAKAPTNK